MYNKQLDTFLKVAELGSFSKAATALYITPSAVIQQINSLENSLNVRLLTRTPRGTELTAAGALLAQEGKTLIEQCSELCKQLSVLQEQSQRILRLGTSLFYQCRVFYDLWNRFCKENQPITISTQMITAPFDLENSSFDLVESVLFYKELPPDMNFLELTKTPLVCALWHDHPLAQKAILRYEDMHDQTLLTISSPTFADILYDLQIQAEQHFAQVRPIPPVDYAISTFSMCALKGYLLQIPQVWQDIHPQLISIPCEWDYTLPYGFYYRESSPLAVEFISFVKTLIRTPNFSLQL